MKLNFYYEFNLSLMLNLKLCTFFPFSVTLRNSTLNLLLYTTLNSVNLPRRRVARLRIIFDGGISLILRFKFSNIFSKKKKKKKK